MYHLVGWKKTTVLMILEHVRWANSNTRMYRHRCAFKLLGGKRLLFCLLYHG
jgi:hypothetical protein